jgi:UTP pyrophosphatase
MSKLKYIAHYSEQTLHVVSKLIDENKIEEYLLKKYEKPHSFKTDKLLFEYVNELKNAHMKKSDPLSKVIYDGKINVIKNALGTHSYISRVQGAKLKSKNEIRVASLFKNVPEEFLRMIVIHELAHFKEKEHNKYFYKLCTYMDSSYHQLEFDLRLYLTQMEIYKKIDQWN